MFTFVLRFVVQPNLNLNLNTNREVRTQKRERYVFYPCRCLCFAFVQMMRTTPRRRTTLHLSQIFFTDALTFMMSMPSRRSGHAARPAGSSPGRLDRQRAA